jgi:hypothetical protein
MVYNGAGFTKTYGGLGLYPEDDPDTATVNENETLDTLTSEVKLNSAKFKWTGHTYDHENLDVMLYNTLFNNELKPNDTVRTKFGFTNYTKNTLVTPDVSGLYSLDAMRAAADFGISYLVSDTSRPTPPAGSGCAAGSYSLPPSSTGKYNCLEPRIYEVPRYPTALFYNVSTPAEWTAEYNYFYGANGIDPSKWGVNLTYNQILDKTSEVLLSYLLTYDLRPLMFHQTNLRAYSGTKSLLGDLIDATLVKYNKYYKNLPIRSDNLNNIGILMKRRTVYNGSAVTGVLTPGRSIVLKAKRGDGQAVVVPVTGVSFGTSKQTYGGQNISLITLNPTNGYTTTVTPAPAW